MKKCPNCDEDITEAVAVYETCDTLALDEEGNVVAKKQSAKDKFPREVLCVHCGGNVTDELGY